MKIFHKVIYATLGLALLLGVGVGWNFFHTETPPQVYYLEGIVTQLQAKEVSMFSSDVFGTLSIKSIEGRLSRRVSLYQFPSEERIPSGYEVQGSSDGGIITATFLSPLKRGIEGFSSPQEVIKISLAGKLLSREIQESPNSTFRHEEAISSSKKYIVTTSTYCAEVVTEGPCALKFRVEVSKKDADNSTSSYTWTYDALLKNRNVIDPGIRLIGFSPDERFINIEIASRQENIDVAFVQLSLETHEAKTFYEGHSKDNGEKGIDEPWRFVRLSRNEKDAFITKRNFSLGKTQIAKLSLQSGEISEVMDFEGSLSNDGIAPTDDAVIYNKDALGELVYKRFDGSFSRILPGSKTHIMWSHDGKWFAYEDHQVGDYNAPVRVYLEDVLGKQKRFIFRQPQKSEYDSNRLKVGAKQYALVTVQ